MPNLKFTVRHFRNSILNYYCEQRIPLSIIVLCYIEMFRISE